MLDAQAGRDRTVGHDQRVGAMRKERERRRENAVRVTVEVGSDSKRVEENQPQSDVLIAPDRPKADETAIRGTGLRDMDGSNMRRQPFGTLPGRHVGRRPPAGAFILLLVRRRRDGMMIVVMLVNETRRRLTHRHE